MKHLIFLFFVLMSLLASSSCGPAHPTNLAAQDVYPHAFRFEDFTGSNALNTALRTLFPVGTAKSDIDSTLIGKEAAYSVNSSTRLGVSPPLAENERKVMYYKKTKPRPFGCQYAVRAVFDDNDKLTRELSANYGCDG